MAKRKKLIKCQKCGNSLPRDAFDLGGGAPYADGAPHLKRNCRKCLNKPPKKQPPGSWLSGDAWYEAHNLTCPENPNPAGLCLCGCGMKTKIAEKTTRHGNVRGYPKKYVRGHAIATSGRMWEEDTETGCWIWQRSQNNQSRPQVVIWDSDNKKGVHMLGHRWVYREYRGEIPDGMELDHLCCNPQCVNPDHLEPVTPNENKARTARRLRLAGLIWIKTGEIP